MPKIETLKKREEFKEVLKKGKVLKADYFLIYILPNSSSKNRIGFILNKKIGKISKRNLIRRRLRGAYRELLPQMRSGYDLVVIGRRRILEADFQDILKTLKKTILPIICKEEKNEG